MKSRPQRVPTVLIKEIRRKQKGKVFQLTIRETNNEGIRIRRRIVLGNSKIEAEKERDKIISDYYLWSRGYLDNNIKDINLEELVSVYKRAKEAYHSRNTKKTRKNHFAVMLDFLKNNFPKTILNVKKLEIKHIREFINYLRTSPIHKGKPLEPKTINNYLGSMKTLFQFAIAEGYIKNNPLKDVKKLPITAKGRVAYYTNEELKIIFTLSDKNYLDAYKFIVLTGLRKGELINLTWNNVHLDKDLKDIEIRSNDSWRTKTGNARVIPLHNDAVRIIEKQKGKHTEYVFVSPQKHKLSDDRFYQSLKKTLIKNGIEGNIHKLRHTFGSNLAMGGVPIITIAELMGHTDTETTKLYAHLSPKSKKDAVDKLQIP